MTEQEQFDAWLAKVCARPLPGNKMARLEFLARELADGIVEEIWDNEILNHKITIIGNENQSNSVRPLYLPGYLKTGQSELVDLYLQQAQVDIHEGNPTPTRQAAYLTKYLSLRWDFICPDIDLLLINEYIKSERRSDPFGISNQVFILAKAAFDLLKETDPTTIFISYRRDDSSAFALLVLARLKQHGLEAFLDMALQPGEDWHAGLKERIQQYDFFVALLGKDTLQSEYVRKEILWALEVDLIILPIWHNGFEYQPEDWPDLEPEIDEVLRTRHTIRVVEENAREYDGALTELLNRFGVTPE